MPKPDAHTPKRIAYLCSRDVMPGDPGRREDAFEQDQQIACLSEALAAHGMRIEPVAWDDPSIDDTGFAAILPLACWDYDRRAEEFLQRLERAEAAGALLLNPLKTVRWNAQKSYLRDLEQAGVTGLPTVWLDRPNPEAIARAFDTLNSDDLVIKRVIGAGARGQFRLKRGESVPSDIDPTRAVMVQAFEPGIIAEGELSFLFMNPGASRGRPEFSHALLKKAAPGDYRIQSLYGGKETPHAATPEDAAQAGQALASVSHDWLYARVDMVRGADGRLRLMELEMIEPFLYPMQGWAVGEALAKALAARLT
jgi:glutathione synthase/RimK-type ligase-like ATP-grasp enzyme